MITVVTPTIRKEGLDIVARSLQKQTYDDWEWLICSPFDPEIPFATWIPDTFAYGFWTLNRAYNALFQEAKADIIVSWQDYIYIPPTGLETFWETFGETPQGDKLISGVGDQYAKIDSFGKPYDKVWSDPRKTHKYGTFYECTWNDIEFNWAAIPRWAWEAVGGFDEGLDFLGFGGDQLQFCQRLNDLGYHFYLDQTNESYTLRHTREDFGGQECWDDNHVLFNGEYEKRKKQLLKEKSWPKLVDKGRSISYTQK